MHKIIHSQQYSGNKKMQEVKITSCINYIIRIRLSDNGNNLNLYQYIFGQSLYSHT